MIWLNWIRVLEIIDDAEVPAVTIATTNRIVNTINEQKLNRIHNREYTYQANLDGDFEKRKLLQI